MKLMISATLAAVMMVASSAQAATQNSQHGKMVTCNQQASGKTGDERARFMKHCLASGKSTHTRGHKKGSGTATHSTDKATAEIRDVAFPLVVAGGGWNG